MNDAIAAACRRDPQRFRGFAHLPFNDMKLALEEMRRALDELGFVGVLVTSNIGGRYLDSAEFYPFWEEANRRRLPVFMHPSSSPCYRDDQPGPLLSFPFDTTLSVYRLIYGGLYELLPDIVLIVAHLGGTLPFLARRTDLVFDVPGFFPGYKPPARRPSEWMRKLYVDTALGWNGGAFNCARELVGLDHIVFGTDYFVRSTRFMEWTIEFIDGLGLAASEREMIYEKNARQILNLGAADLARGGSSVWMTRRSRVRSAATCLKRQASRALSAVSVALGAADFVPQHNRPGRQPARAGTAQGQHPLGRGCDRSWPTDRRAVRGCQPGPGGVYDNFRR